MKAKKKFCAFLFCLAALLCSSYPARGGESARDLFSIEPLAQKTKINLAYFSGSVHGLVHYVAQEKGWFKDANLEVEFLPFFNGPAIMEAKRSWDIGSTGAPGMISGIIGQDVPMIGFAFWDNILDLFVRPDHPIYTSGKGHIPGYPEIYGKPEDWKGTQWLLPAGTTMHLVIITTLERMGLTDKDITLSSMDVSSAYTAFKAKQGDGLGVWSTLAMMATDAGNKKVSGILECGAKMATTLFANSDSLKTKREAIKKYLEVYLAAAHWVDTHRDEGAEYYVVACEEEGINIDPEQARRVVASATTPTLSEQIRMAETKVADPANPEQQISELEKVMIDTFDFFAGQGRYREEDRKKILSGYVDSSVIMELKSDYEKAGKAIQ